MKVNIAGIMVPIGEYPVIPEDTSVYSAARALVENYRNRDGTWTGYELLLVEDRQKEIVGYITLRSFLKAIGLSNGENVNKLMDILFSNPRLNHTELKVKSIVQSVEGRMINVNEDLIKVVEKIMKNSANSIMVVDGDKAVGVVRVIDLLWFIEDLLS